MSKAWIALGVLAAVSAGVVIGKKYIDKNPGALVAVKENYGEKLHSASVYCAGAIKTGSEKVRGSVNSIVAASKEKGAKVKEKGAQIVSKAKTATSGFKNELENLKDMVSSVGKGASVDISEDVDPLVFEEEMGEAVEAADAVEQTQAL